MQRFSLAVVNSHPVQYFAPLYRRLAEESDIDLTVYYCSRAGLESFRDAGFDQDVSWDIPLLEDYRSKFLANLSRSGFPSGFFSCINPGIIREIRDGDYDAVWLHGHNHATNLIAVAAATWTGTSLYMRCETHLGLDRPGWKRTLRTPVMTLFYRIFDAMLAIGSRNAEFYEAHGVDESEIFLVPYTVENERFRQGAQMDGSAVSRVRRSLGMPDPDVPVILYLSKLTRRKRPIDLLRAFRKVQDRTKRPIGLTFAGAGPEAERLRRIADEWNTRNVTFLGFRNQSELPRIYGACDVFVLPSEDEPWGLVVNEAMAAGLPVVVSDEVGAGEDLVIEGRNGWVYPCGDVAALSQRLEQLVSDPDHMKEMGRASQEVIGDWDIERCVRGVREALSATVPDTLP